MKIQLLKNIKSLLTSPPFPSYFCKQIKHFHHQNLILCYETAIIILFDSLYG